MSNNKPTLTDQKSKIFPRNLTARAAYVVPGNPVVTRTEDGVDNCYPGLEMDAKNIQKYFMPGLYFEVYSSAGTRLVSLTPSAPNQPWYSAGLKESDTETEKGVYLWAIKGRVAEDQDPADPPITELGYTYNMGGLYGWRMINALFPGKVAIVLGTGTPPDKDSEQWQAIQTLLNKQWQSNKSVVMRDAQGALEQAVIIGDRSNYLNEQGVLDPDVYTPGELTRTLCTPWTYDFRDCQCFYWASNKPDVNASEDGKYEFLNFQRKNYQVEPQTSDIANNYIGRRKRELDYADLMVDWEQLRPVLNGRECGQSYTPEPGPVEEGYWDKAEIIEELTYAASIEHALAVQYLYAYYSINAPTTAPDQNTGKAEVVNIYNAAQIVFNIAVDEMRHLRWANEALRLWAHRPPSSAAPNWAATCKCRFIWRP